MNGGDVKITLYGVYGSTICQPVRSEFSLRISLCALSMEHQKMIDYYQKSGTLSLAHTHTHTHTQRTLFPNVLLVLRVLRRRRCTVILDIWARQALGDDMNWRRNRPRW